MDTGNIKNMNKLKGSKQRTVGSVQLSTDA